jgi:hypothetical protein
VCADALLMCRLVMSINLFFRCMFLVSLMVPMYVSYESHTLLQNLVSLMLLSLMLLHNLRCVALMSIS